MPNESFFMTFGGLGLSLAGFAGLISALDRSPGGRSPIAAYRIRNIVFLGFSLSFAGLATVAAYTATNADLPLTVRIGTTLLTLMMLKGLLIDMRPGPAWPDERERRVSLVIILLMLAVTLGNLVAASVGYLQLLMLMGLIGPVTIFYNTIRAATAPVPDHAEPAAPAASPPDQSV